MILVVVMVVLVTLAFHILGAISWPTEVTDVCKYPGLLKDWKSSGLARHFPPVVPSQATNVRLAAFPGFLQSGAYLQLRMQLPADQVRQIEAQLQQATTRAYVGGGIYEHYNRDPKNNLPTTSFHTADNPATTFDFPAHYTLYVLRSRDGGNWNHGDTAGTAISTMANEVIYWAESW